MSKTSILIVRITCAIIFCCFFMSFFVVSCAGESVSISGMEASFGIDKNNLELNAYPIILLIPLVALFVLAVLTIPTVQNKFEGIKSPIKIINIYGFITSAGGLTGLILLAIVNSIAIAEVKEQGSGLLNYRTGFGFKMSVFAFLVMLAIPFFDIYAMPYVKKYFEKNQNQQPPPNSE